MSTQMDLRRLSPIRRAFVVGFKRAYHRAGEQYREELQALAATHRQQMQTLVATYDQELRSLLADYSALAVKWHKTLRDIAVLQALNERSQNPGQLLH